MRNMNDDSGAVVRLDIALVERGVTDSRSKAQRLIESGKVRVNGTVASKASLKVTAADTLDADLGDDYVSRGAYKLVGAFDMFSQTGLRSAEGFDCLDIGASTGGFCDVLLRRGAAHVIALDVGHGQLDPRIAGNERIIEMSGVNIRDVEADDLPYRPSMIVSDVSFISLTYVIPVIARIAAPGAHVVLLVKPQFEVGKGNLGKNGIVESETLRKQALDTIDRLRESQRTGCTRHGGLTDRRHARQHRVSAVCSGVNRSPPIDSVKMKGRWPI